MHRTMWGGKREWCPHRTALGTRPQRGVRIGTLILVPGRPARNRPQGVVIPPHGPLIPDHVTVEQEPHS